MFSAVWGVNTGRIKMMLSKRATNVSLGVSAVLLASLMTTSCVNEAYRKIVLENPIPIIPIPIGNFAPNTTLIEKVALFPAIASVSSNGSNRRSGNSRLALRGGRPVVISDKIDIDQLLAKLPTSEMKNSFLPEVYIPPFGIRESIKEGEKHYLNFTISAEYAAADKMLLKGDAEGALAQFNKILDGASRTEHCSEQAGGWYGNVISTLGVAKRKTYKCNLYFDVSQRRVMTLTLLGRFSDALDETKRAEKWEVRSFHRNVKSFSLKAEVKYWSGDYLGAIKDAVSVLRSVGDWRLPTSYSSPPADQEDLMLVTSAQTRAAVILGLVLISQKRHQDALPWLKLANQTMNNVLFIYRHPLYGLYFPFLDEVFYGRGWSLIALATALQMIDPESEKAQILFSRGNDYFNAIRYNAGPILTSMYKTHAFLAAGQYAKAISAADVGIGLADRNGLMDYRWKLFALKGEAQIQLKQFADARVTMESAQQIIDLLSGTMASDEAKIRFGVGKDVVTKNLVSLALNAQNNKKAIEYAERGRARAFIDLLTDKQLANGRSTMLVDQIRQLNVRIVRERQRKNAYVKQASDSIHENRLLAQRRTLIGRLRQVDGDLADTMSVKGVDVSRLLKLIPAQEYVLYTFPTLDGEKLRLGFLGNGRIKVLTLEATQKNIHDALKNFGAVENYTDRTGQHATIRAVEKLLKLEAWPQMRRMHVVPSGHMHFIPWGALKVRYPVSVLPTLDWINRPSAASKGRQAVIVGDPQFGRMLPQLEGARDEARALSKTYDVPALIGVSATEPGLRRAVGSGTSVLHLATHALFDPLFPLKSAFFLSDGKHAHPVTAEVILKKPIPADVVVLSACETGMGKVISGDDLLGLSRSFYLGGSKAILSSLWPVEDAATKAYMDAFHKEARRSDIGTAWLRARDHLVSEGYPPMAYGAFVLGGTTDIRL
jgi:tetratricopeptide (TPR) repeat protein